MRRPAKYATAVPKPPAHPAICLNMIVRNEAHIVREVLDAVAPYISSWVIVDTGSDDGTQDVIREHLAALGIPGELHERPWVNFGHNRTEALELAQGHGDYIWVMDADDMLHGTPDFTGLDADLYLMLIGVRAIRYWRHQLFRDGARVRYVGVVHELAQCDDDAYVAARLEGEYFIESRRLGARNQDQREKYSRDAALLLAEVERNPDDARSVFYLAQSYFDLGDFASARRWYARRVELGGGQEEAFYAMFRVALSMHRLGEPWPDVLDAYLRAWEFRPTRAEPLIAVARKYRADGVYQLGYLFARQTAEIPYPESDEIYNASDVYAWGAADEQAIAAEWIGRKAEAFALCRRLLARPDIPDDERQRIARNRDYSVAAMLEAASSYPEAVVRSLAPGASDAEVTVTLEAGSDVEATLNSFLNCCTDIHRAGRFVVVGAGSDRCGLAERYPFLEFADTEPEIGGRFWLRIGAGWRFFAPEDYLTRLIAVLQAEADVVQVGINFTDASQLTGSCAAEDAVRRAPGAGRYVLTDKPATGPALVDTTRSDRAGTASLDEVLCIAGQ